MCSRSMFVITAIDGDSFRNERSLSSASDDHVLAPAEPGVAAERAQPAADDRRRIEPGALEHQRHHRRRRRLAVRAGDRDPVAEPHQLGQHLGARDHRDAAAPGLDDLRVVRRESPTRPPRRRRRRRARRRVRSTTRTPSCSSRSVTSERFASEPLTSYPRLASSSAIPLMPMPADADEMNPPRPAEHASGLDVRRSAAPVRAAVQRSDRRSTPAPRRGLSASASRCRGRDIVAPQPTGRESRDAGLAIALGEQRAGQLLLLDHLGRPGRGEHLGVLALVIVGGGRQRHEHRRPAGGRQLRDRRRAGAADDEVGRPYFPVHGEQERLHPGLEPRAAVPVPDEFQIALSCLMRDRQPARVGCQLRRRLHHGHVDRVRALGAAKDQHPRQAPRRALRRRSLPTELGTHRIACDKAPPSEIARRRLERHRRRADDPREQPVRQAGHRVLLEQQRRDAAQRRGEHDRARSCSRRRRSPGPAERRDRIRHASTPLERQQQHRAQQRGAGDVPFRPGAAQQVELEPLARHDPRPRSRARFPQTSSRRPAGGAAARARRRCPG